MADVLFVALAAVLCGATSEVGMAWFAQDRLELLRQYVPLTNGAPRQDAFSQVFRASEGKDLEAALRQLMTAYGHEARQGSAGNLRRAYEAARTHMPCLTGHVPGATSGGNLALVRRLGQAVLRADPEKIPLTHKMARASWSAEGLLRAMAYMR